MSETPRTDLLEMQVKNLLAVVEALSMRVTALEPKKTANASPSAPRAGQIYRLKSSPHGSPRLLTSVPNGPMVLTGLRGDWQNDVTSIGEYNLVAESLQEYLDKGGNL